MAERNSTNETVNNQEDKQQISPSPSVPSKSCGGDLLELLRNSQTPKLKPGL